MGPKGVSEKRLDPHRRGGYSRNENGRRRHENVRFAQRPGLALPADKTVELKPGDYHVMLVDLKIPLRKDTTIQVPVQMTPPQAAAAHGALIQFRLCVGWLVGWLAGWLGRGLSQLEMKACGAQVRVVLRVTTALDRGIGKRVLVRSRHSGGSVLLNRPGQPLSMWCT
jgi:hypothetical protein